MAHGLRFFRRLDETGSKPASSGGRDFRAHFEKDAVEAHDDVGSFGVSL